MKTLAEIKDGEFPSDKSVLKTREAARAVLFDNNNLIPLLFVSKYNYHKLPGGGIEDGEDRIKALIREAKEEVGCAIEVTGEVGQIIEFRSKWNLSQTSYCYIGKIISQSKPNFTTKESNQGFEIVWTSLDVAISKIKNDKPKSYEGICIQKRDIVFLQKAKQIL